MTRTPRAFGPSSEAEREATAIAEDDAWLRDALQRATTVLEREYWRAVVEGRAARGEERRERRG